MLHTLQRSETHNLTAVVHQFMAFYETRDLYNLGAFQREGYLFLIKGVPHQRSSLSNSLHRQGEGEGTGLGFAVSGGAGVCSGYDSRPSSISCCRAARCSANVHSCAASARAVGGLGGAGAKFRLLGGNGESSIVLGKRSGPTHWLYTKWRKVSINPAGLHHAIGMFEHGLFGFIICACMLSITDSFSSKMVTVGTTELVNAKNTATGKCIYSSSQKKSSQCSSIFSLTRVAAFLLGRFACIEVAINHDHRQMFV